MLLLELLVGCAWGVTAAPLILAPTLAPTLTPTLTLTLTLILDLTLTLTRSHRPSSPPTASGAAGAARRRTSGGPRLRRGRMVKVQGLPRACHEPAKGLPRAGALLRAASLAGPQLGSCACSGRAWWLCLARHIGVHGEPRPHMVTTSVTYGCSLCYIRLQAEDKKMEMEIAKSETGTCTPWATLTLTRTPTPNP